MQQKTVLNWSKALFRLQRVLKLISKKAVRMVIEPRNCVGLTAYWNISIYARNSFNYAVCGQAFLELLVPGVQDDIDK